MSAAIHPLVRLIEEDSRYPLAAYQFVSESLAYAHEVMGLGKPEPVKADVDEALSGGSLDVQRHVTGQQLCEASRRYARARFGYMAKVVLNSWGIHATSDLGEIVYNLIRARLMQKSPHDRREDFDGVFDFQQAFCDDFRFDARKLSWPKFAESASLYGTQADPKPCKTAD